MRRSSRLTLPDRDGPARLRPSAYPRDHSIPSDAGAGRLAARAAERAGSRLRDGAVSSVVRRQEVDRNGPRCSEPRASPIARGLVACHGLVPVGGRGGARTGTAVSTSAHRPARLRAPARSASPWAPPTSPTSERRRSPRSAAGRGRGAAVRPPPPSPRPRTGLPDVEPETVRRRADRGAECPRLRRPGPARAIRRARRRDDDRRGDRSAHEAEPRPDRLPHGDPHGGRRHPHGQPPRQPDLLRRHPARPVWPLLVPPTRRPAAERRQHHLSPRRVVQTTRPHPAVQDRQAGLRGPAPGRCPQSDRQPLHGLRGRRRRGPDRQVQRTLCARDPAAPACETNSSSAEG